MHCLFASSGKPSEPARKSCGNLTRDFCNGHKAAKRRERRLKFWVGRMLWASFVICIVPLSGAARGQTVASSSGTEWHTYGHDAGGERFSPLKQINPANVDQLQRAWTYKVPAFPGGGVVAFESTPLMVDDVLYFAAPTGQAIALDAETGKQLWMFNPFSGVSQPPNPVPNRGVAYWRASGARSRILYVSADAHLYALDAATGKPCMDFGDGGSVDLRAGVATKWPQLRYDDTSPPVIYKDVVIVGSEVQEYPSIGPSGAVRAFDVHTGNLSGDLIPCRSPARLGTIRGRATIGKIAPVPMPGACSASIRKTDWSFCLSDHPPTIFMARTEREKISLEIRSSL